MSRFIDLFVIGDGEESPARGLRRVAALETFPRRPRIDALRDGQTVPFRLCAAILSATNSIQQGRTIAVRPVRTGLARAHPTGHGRFGVHSPARRPGGAARRVRPGADRRRNHARMSGQVPVLPKHHHQTPAAIPQGGNHCPGGLGVVSQHRVQRNFAPLAFHQRLSAFRRTSAATARGPATAGRGHLAAQPANQRGIASRSAI